MTNYFTRTVTFPDLNDLECDGEFSADDDGNVFLESVKLGNKACSPALIEEIVGRAAVDANVESAQDWWTADGWAEAEQAEADDRGDHEYEIWRDEQGEAA